MNLRRIVVACVAMATMPVLSAGGAAADRLPGSELGGLPESTTLLGANQVPPVASPGSGTARITLNPGHDELCYQVTVANLSSPVIAAHIHEGPAGTNAPIVIPFVAPTTGSSEGCVTISDTLMNGLREDPAGFYVNVHTTAHPGGEVRGQLGRG
jgi:hypothetical protein